MEDTGKTPETGSQGQLKNDASSTSAPAADNSSAAEVERLRKVAEQAEMRANQLANQLSEKTKAEEEAKRKQLEENEEFKTLYERSQAENADLRRGQEDAAKKAAVDSAKSGIFAKFPKEVVEIAETTGLSLNDDSDEAKQQLEGKLKALQDKVSPKKTPGGNNPAPHVEVAPERAELINGMKVGHQPSIRQAISGLESMNRLRQVAGVERVEQ